MGYGFGRIISLPSGDRVVFLAPPGTEPPGDGYCAPGSAAERSDGGCSHCNCLLWRLLCSPVAALVLLARPTRTVRVAADDWKRTCREAKVELGRERVPWHRWPGWT